MMKIADDNSHNRQVENKSNEEKLKKIVSNVRITEKTAPSPENRTTNEEGEL
jgi:hypothetical protein